jgi:hypothetical protein
VSSRPATSRQRKRNAPNFARKKSSARAANTALALFLCFLLAVTGWWFHRYYALSFQSPVRLSFHWPVVIAERTSSESAVEAQTDQNGRRLSAWQQYACKKFGSDCRLALAIQRAENPNGKCEIYHYNSDGTLDWGYFQINTVHLQRPGLNLRDLLDCQANIDFAYQLYREKGGFTPWSTFNNGRYRQFMAR